MAKRSDLGGEVVSIVDSSPAAKKRRELHKARRVEAMSLLLAGLTYAQIGARLRISEDGAIDLVRRTLARAENRVVEEQRALENARLDRAQAAIWSNVLKGDVKAVDTFLRISARRSKMNGLDEPMKIDLSLSVRAEMEAALSALENTILGEVIHDDGGAG